jgi:replicative DNA helicase
MSIEKYFIGQIFWDPSIAGRTVLTPSDFLSTQEQQIFSSMQSLVDEGSIIDEQTVSKKSGLPLGTILPFKDIKVIPSTWEHYQKQIIDASRIRTIKKTCEQILASELPADRLMDMFVSGTEQARIQQIFKPYPLSQCIDESIKALEERVSSKSLPGLTTGFRRLDTAFGGLQKGRLYYIGARPSQGKSTLLMNIAINSKVPCLIFSAESSRREYADRMIIKQEKINSMNFYNGTLTEKDTAKVVQASNELYQRDYVIIHDEPNISLRRLIQVAHDAYKYYKIKAIFIDYIQLITYGDQTRAKNEQVSEISKRLKQLARELDIPVIAAAQLRRDAEGKQPQLSDFSDSTQIERDADVAIMVYHIQNATVDRSTDKETFLLIQKNRDGRLDYVKMNYQPGYMLFEEARDQALPPKAS